MIAGLRLLALRAGLGLALLASPVLAQVIDTPLADPAAEARARDISRTLRCLVCQNQSIDDSDAPLARDLRVLVRERLVAGDSDQAVIDFVVARYGDFVLLSPPVNGRTILLWGAPFGILALGMVFLWRRRRTTVEPAAATPALSPEEERRLAELVDRERD